MTLTEEQRAALKRVVAYMDEMYAIASPYYGCTEDANILRAMIDSSGTVEPVGGFDLERARGLRDFLQDDCAEVGDVWAEMIAEIERLRARDRQAAAAIVAMAEGAKQHVLKTHTIMKNVFDEADSLAGYCEELENIVITKDARIKELEDVHKRSGVKYAKIINELRSSVYANIPGLKKQWDEILNTPANDKIGPSEEQIRAKMAELPSTPGPYRPAIREEAIRQLDVKPRSWQITEERVGLLEYCLESLLDAPDIDDYSEPRQSIRMLRAMLTEADHDKP